jgi:hypothetical protein
MVKEMRWGEDRNEPPPAVDPRSDAKVWPVRRILATRKATKSNHSATQYHVEWDTTWEELSTLQNHKSALEDFNNDENTKFTYTDAKGIEWTVLSDDGPLENDSESAKWEMWQAICRHVKTEVCKNWFMGMKDDRDPETGRKFSNRDFDISESEFRKAKKIANDQGKKLPTSALEILKYTYEQLDLGASTNSLLYGDIEVKFIGRIDYRNDKALEYAGKSIAVRETVGRIFAGAFDDIDENVFTRKADTYGRARGCRDEIQKLIGDAPYMFRPGSWVLLFALLIYGGDKLRELMKDEACLRTEANWNNYSREYSLQMYYEHINDNRPPHAIQETFLTLRTFFRELEPEKELNGRTKRQESRKSNRTHRTTGREEYSPENALLADNNENSMTSEVQTQDEIGLYDDLGWETDVSRNADEEDDHDVEIYASRDGSESPDLVSPTKLGPSRREMRVSYEAEIPTEASLLRHGTGDSYEYLVTGAPRLKRARDIILDAQNRTNTSSSKKARKVSKNRAK